MVRKVRPMIFEPAIGISSGAWYDNDLMKSSNQVMNEDAQVMLEESYNQQGKATFKKGKLIKHEEPEGAKEKSP